MNKEEKDFKNVVKIECFVNPYGGTQEALKKLPIVINRTFQNGREMSYPCTKKQALEDFEEYLSQL
tara:strand:+ start:561 stop:758 length:198 start_codon:yes stop_codon:yes gene_type:complete